MQREKLSEAEVEQRLESLEGWKFKDDKIKKKFEFEDFAGALEFVNRVGEIAERLDHHPDIKFGWGYAKIKTTTHDRGGVTDFDIELARGIDALTPATESHADASAGNGT